MSFTWEVLKTVPQNNVVITKKVKNANNYYTILAQIVSVVSAVSAFALPLSYGGHEYELVPGLDWTDAEISAIGWGGHLATVNDAAEDAWLFSNFGYKHYIGLNDIDVEGVWEWISGEAVTYTHWAPGEPNNGTAANWVQINWGYDSTGGWNDTGPSWTYPGNPWHSGYGIAERDASGGTHPIPEPATCLLLSSGLAGLAAFRKKFALALK